MSTERLTDEGGRRARRPDAADRQQAGPADAGQQGESLDTTASRGLVADRRLYSRANAPLQAAAMQRLQQTYGNRAVQRLVAAQRFSAGEAEPLEPERAAGRQASATAPPPPQPQEAEQEPARGAAGQAATTDPGSTFAEGEAQQFAAPPSAPAGPSPDGDTPPETAPDTVRIRQIVPGSFLDLAAPLAGADGVSAVRRLFLVARTVFLEHADGSFAVQGSLSFQTPVIDGQGKATSTLLTPIGRLETTSPGLPGVRDITAGSIAIPDRARLFGGNLSAPGDPASPSFPRTVGDLTITGGRLIAI